MTDISTIGPKEFNLPDIQRAMSQCLGWPAVSWSKIVAERSEATNLDDGSPILS